MPIEKATKKRCQKMCVPYHLEKYAKYSVQTLFFIRI